MYPGWSRCFYVRSHFPCQRSRYPEGNLFFGYFSNLMSPNAAKSCGFCGSKKHNLRTCTLPGASELRRLRALTQPKTKSSGSRVVRGNSEAARRTRQTVLKRPATLRRPAAVVRQQYSGPLGLSFLVLRHCSWPL